MYLPGVPKLALTSKFQSVGFGTQKIHARVLCAFIEKLPLRKSGISELNRSMESFVVKNGFFKCRCSGSYLFSMGVPYTLYCSLLVNGLICKKHPERIAHQRILNNVICDAESCNDIE